MIFWIGLSLTLLCLLAAARVGLYRVTRQLRAINDRQTGTIVRVSVCDPGLEALAAEINRTLRAQEQRSLQIREYDDRLRQSIADISHDFCTPLTSVSGYLQLLQMDGALPERDRQYAARALRKADYLNTLIKSYFELSVYESNSYALALEALNLCELVSAEILNSEVDFKNKALQVQAALPDDALWVNGDKTACRRIVQNLLSNAVRYAGSRVEITLRMEENCCVLCVKNDAAGLSAADAARIFDRFYTADKGRATAGLGLYIVKTLAEKMGGTAESHCGDGMLAVRVKLPAKKEAGKMA